MSKRKVVSSDTNRKQANRVRNGSARRDGGKKKVPAEQEKKGSQVATVDRDGSRPPKDSQLRISETNIVNPRIAAAAMVLRTPSGPRRLLFGRAPFLFASAPEGNRVRIRLLLKPQIQENVETETT